MDVSASAILFQPLLLPAFSHFVMIPWSLPDSPLRNISALSHCLRHSSSPLHTLDVQFTTAGACDIGPILEPCPFLAVFNVPECYLRSSRAINKMFSGEWVLLLEHLACCVPCEGANSFLDMVERKWESLTRIPEDEQDLWSQINVDILRGDNSIMETCFDRVKNLTRRFAPRQVTID